MSTLALAIGALVAALAFVLLRRKKARPVMKIAELLDDCDFPWRMPRRELIARFGIKPHAAYSWDVIEVESGLPLVEGLIYPFYAQPKADFATDLPAVYFAGTTWFGQDARKNFRRTVDALACKLGKPELDSASNTIGCIWHSGAASIQLTIWPEDIAHPPGPNPAHARDPRLAAACHITIRTGFKPPLSNAERAELETIKPFADLAWGNHFAAASVLARPAEDYELEFVREPPGDMVPFFRKIGLSADRSTLIFCHDQLYVVPVIRIIGLLHVRLEPARGPGGANLYLTCTPADPGTPTKSLRVDAKDGGGPSVLDGFATMLAAKLGVPVAVETGYDD